MEGLDMAIIFEMIDWFQACAICDLALQDGQWQGGAGHAPQCHYQSHLQGSLRSGKFDTFYQKKF